ncbi:MAG: hypothetical protein SP1CHLAM54_04680 [Chlamydiia bacterium]|nr:hypothetical protein [Chlamydiia bacterium]MCH9615380.1 hypothetical protein [Chlamydiia bacterium]MCH9628298.1 hypothetical protein [Chlamydiia bacterium]
MIYDLKKTLFIGAKDDQGTFFKKAQDKGFIQFIPQSKKLATDYPKHVLDAIRAIKILHKQPVTEQNTTVRDFDASELVKRTIEVSDDLSRLYDEQTLLTAEIRKVEPFGEFDFEELRELEQTSQHVCQFFTVKHGKLKQPHEDLIFLTTKADMDYYMSFATIRLSIPGLIELHLSRSLSDLRADLVATKAQIASREFELKELAHYEEFLREEYKAILDTYHLKFAKNEVADHFEGGLFSVEGWVPVNKENELDELMAEFAIHHEEISLDPHDRKPTCMENKKSDKIGEDLVHIYDTPSVTDKDPSRWVLWAFALFFAIIVADAGYGFIYLLGALFLKWKVKKPTPGMKRFFNLFTLLACFCIGWGVLTASFFGMELPPTNPLKKVSITHYLAIAKSEYHLKKKDDVYQDWLKKYPSMANATNGEQVLIDGRNKDGKYEILDEYYDNILIELAIVIGIIHIILSQLRFVRREYSGLGWCIFMIGCYLYFPSVVQCTTMVNFLGIMGKHLATIVGLQMLIIGASMAVLAAIIQHGFKGIEEVMKSIQIFADVLSYLRLYALGLASMILADTFNHMDEVVGYAAGIVVLIAGHCVNIVLGIMGGTIHGLRLNFLEWYHYSFEGGGKRFEPLKLLKRRLT